MVILGIDPGTRVTGYGILEKTPAGLTHIGHGEIKPPHKKILSVALNDVFESLMALVSAHQPDALVIETIFYGKNVKSLIRQGHLRGIALLVGPLNGLPVYEYSPLEIKQAVVGYGRAEKHQVQQMVTRLLGLDSPPPPDASDALAMAICHAHSMRKDQT
ncbi:MAG: crossover junction endodeoxyribonuclease RuvC [Syntrophales bacterium]|jgi:crossover junction endodeoxyribonuclease RuvC|nr:crossover junction endodeoxyribonuclease RuvC [Syntrophales bacterium]MCK9527772.1 crossover junction endodeoxyribonuclease RuvC [Syntrophales bacterium]MDX9921573.1 crossover junction endodeoxyribonuclease RuvC [Syntrophales bacterium]